MSSTASPTPAVVQSTQTLPLVTAWHAGTIQRIASLDMLRGVVMVLMALDHVRDYFSNAFVNPLDLAQTTPALFLTRWITHLCAPVFALLARSSAYLYGAQGRTKASVARFLCTRGLFLVALEFTLVHFGWFFNLDYHFLLAQVIWMLGWSMVALAGLIFVPTWLLVLMAAIMIGGHNLLDGFAMDDFGSLGWLWTVLHQPGTIEIAPGRQLFVLSG